MAGLPGCVSVLVILLSCMHSTAAQCPTIEVFVQRPMNRTVNIGDNVTLNCRIAEELVVDNYFIQWSYLLVNMTASSTYTSTNQDAINRRFSTLPNDSLVITNVDSTHDGIYTCFTSNSFFCEDLIFRATADLQVTGPPIISLNNDQCDNTVDNTVDKYCVDTLSTFTLLGFVQGFPTPDVSIYREIDGTFQLLTSATNSRFSSQPVAPNGDLTISLENIKNVDGGRYMIIAYNIYGRVNETFEINPQGPDPPLVTVESMVVSHYNSQVSTICSIQADAIIGATIQWKNKQDDEVPKDAGAVFTSSPGNGSLRLTIASLNSSLVGNYTCMAINPRGSHSMSLEVFGPPPPPAHNPRVDVANSDVTVSWRKPDSPITITQYGVTIYKTDTMTFVKREMVLVSPDQSEVSYTFSNIPPGRYVVTVYSLADAINSTETDTTFFSVEEPEFPLIAVVVAASVGGVIFLLVVASLAIGCYCYCSIKARRSKANSHQQRWGSEENKVGQETAPAVQNTYTALALQDNVELPPSPMSPMTSSIGIDPMWEFPRENITLSDVLTEGQFTVLYKGTARNLKEKPCDVAIKSLKDDATKDDVNALISEMELLSGIEEHANIISLVRVCTVGKPLYMVMEYMCHGDLLGFLRACRGHHGMYTVSPGNRYHPPSFQLCSRDLLNMATKIANGMSYLAERKIVHRALCTRNILVGSGMDVKIYNVGSHDVTLDGMVKWMAPETLYDGTNTTYSDVWSFGVTLWELVTIGGIPYAEINPDDLYTQLQSGTRMSCPPHCAQEVYDIMSACWQKNPTDRPHFAIIHENLDELVMSKLNYLDLRSYDGFAYSQFGTDVPPLSTAL